MKKLIDLSKVQPKVSFGFLFKFQSTLIVIYDYIPFRLFLALKVHKILKFVVGNCDDGTSEPLDNVELGIM